MTRRRITTRYASLPLSIRWLPAIAELSSDERHRVFGELWSLHAIGYDSEQCERVQLSYALQVVPLDRLEYLEALGFVRLADSIVWLLIYGHVHQTADQLAEHREGDRERNRGKSREGKRDRGSHGGDDKSKRNKDDTRESPNNEQERESAPESRESKALSPHVGKGTSPRNESNSPRFVKRFEELADALRSKRTTGRSLDDFTIACPVHRGDGDPVHVTIDRERIKAYCHKPGCHVNGKAIALALGFKGGDLYARTLDRPRRGSNWQSFEIRDRMGSLFAIQKRLEFENRDGEPDKKFAWFGPDCCVSRSSRQFAHGLWTWKPEAHEPADSRVHELRVCSGLKSAEP